MKKRKVAVITGTRADYGLLRPILRKIKKSKKLDLFLIVTGMHLSKRFGLTIKEIQKDGFEIYATIKSIKERDDTGAGMAEHIGTLVKKLTKVLKNLNPDFMLILGDRSEMLASAIVGVCMNILLFHIHGGESSGSVDQSFRHAISKLAHIHFVATEKGRKYLMSIGEDPKRIYVVGAPGLDEIREGFFTPPEEVYKKFKIDKTKPLVLLVQHPVVTEVEDSERQIRETLDALIELELQTIVIYPNADPGGRRMIKVIQEYSRKYPNLFKVFKSLPREDYLGIMNVASVMVGNSSSGIIEAASFGLPVVNIGTRQRGRERSKNVIDVKYDKEEIKKALIKALTDKKWIKQIRKIKNPWGDGKASERIVRILERITDEEIKKFLQK